MKKSNTNCITLKGIKSRKIFADFNGGKITSDAGVLLLRQANQRTKFLRDFSAAIIDKRHPSYIDHSYETMITQRVFGIACGYEDGNDHQELRNDPMFQVGVNREPGSDPLASPPTLCRLEKSVTRKDLVSIAKTFIEHFIKSFRKSPKELVLDFDATDDRIHGKQEGAFFHGYYYDYCYLPLYVFCNDKLIVSYLRPSNIDPAKHAWAILALLVKRFRQEWPNVTIKFRADGGFCRHQMLTWCDKNGIEYAVGIGSNSRLKKVSAHIVKKSRTLLQRENKKIRIFGEVRYGALTWSYERRIIVKAEQLDKGENVRFVVTNMSDVPENIYDCFYTARGDMENRIKEQQLALFADRTSCQKFLSNQLRLFLSSAAYFLLEYIRCIALRGTELAKAQCQTIRNKLLKIGALVIWNTRRIQIKMSEYFVYKKIFRLAVKRLTPS